MRSRSEKELMGPKNERHRFAVRRSEKNCPQLMGKNENRPTVDGKEGKRKNAFKIFPSRCGLFLQPHLRGTGKARARLVVFFLS